MKEIEERKHSFHPNEPSLYDRSFEINKVIEILYMKQVNKLSKVKIVIKINFYIKKVNVKDVNKSVP